MKRKRVGRLMMGMWGDEDHLGPSWCDRIDTECDMEDRD